MSGNIRKLDKCSLLPTLRTASGTDTLGVINNSLIELKVYSKNEVKYDTDNLETNQRKHGFES